MKKNVLFVALFIGFALSVFAQNVSDFEYVEKDGKIAITKYNGSVKDVKIPEKINGMPVYLIGFRAFQGKGITRVIIPDSVTLIYPEAFANNRLYVVTIPK